MTWSEAQTAISDKNAEIARLKADVEYWHDVATIEKNGLITELCDALELGNKLLPDVREIVLQRAREAIGEHRK